MTPVRLVRGATYRHSYTKQQRTAYLYRFRFAETGAYEFSDGDSAPSTFEVVDENIMDAALMWLGSFDDEVEGERLCTDDSIGEGEALSDEIISLSDLTMEKFEAAKKWIIQTRGFADWVMDSAPVWGWISARAYIETAEGVQVALALGPQYAGDPLTVYERIRARFLAIGPIRGDISWRDTRSDRPHWYSSAFYTEIVKTPRGSRAKSSASPEAHDPQTLH